MDQPSDLSSAAASTTLLQIGPNRDPRTGSGPATEGNGSVGSAEMTRLLVQDRDRIAQYLNDVVVRRLFAAGLDLDAALGLVDDHRAVGKVHHAIGELDEVIKDLRSAIFGL